MITVPLISWQAMGAMPDSRRDGRQMLLWHPDDGAEVGRWGNHSYRGGEPGWLAADGDFCGAPIYWADINPPI